MFSLTEFQIWGILSILNHSDHFSIHLETPRQPPTALLRGVFCTNEHHLHFTDIKPEALTLFFCHLETKHQEAKLPRGLFKFPLVLAPKLLRYIYMEM